MTRSTCIRNADWVVAWDSAAGRHAYLRGGDVAFAGGALTFVGRGYRGPADETIEGRGLLVMPGLVDLHSHPGLEATYRGIREEHGLPEMFMTGLFERSVAYGPDAEAMLACAEVAYCELLLSGVTTLVDISGAYPGWIDLLGRSGLRGVAAPAYASARWVVRRSHLLEYEWNEAAGRARFDEALRLCAEVATHPSGRLSAMISPAQIDTCTEDLLRDSVAAARERGLPFTVHCAQAVGEFHEMVRRHGITPVQWAHALGLTGARSILGHAIFTDEHSWLHWWSRRDLGLLAETGTTVAHCPTPFARYGQTLESFGKYRRAGVNMGMGTDTVPQNMLEEMRWATVLGRIAAEDIRALEMADVFHAATAGGAAGLGREDIGRLVAGARADLVLVRLDNPWMVPVRDPLRSLIFHAADRAVRDVYVDGEPVVKEGRVLTLDQAGALARLTDGQRRMEATVPERDPRRRRSTEITPLSLPFLGGVEP
ncbi:MAG: amidohydrolase family protein [Candidatus Rokubacteria bacterium]|nr:amidohydrolase family protein [Candidatus Rokubacteria bacterium]